MFLTKQGRKVEFCFSLANYLVSVHFFRPRSYLSTQPFGDFCSFLQNSRKYALRSLRKTSTEGTTPIGSGPTSGQFALNTNNNSDQEVLLSNQKTRGGRFDPRSCLTTKLFEIFRISELRMMYCAFFLILQRRVKLVCQLWDQGLLSA